MTTCEVRLGVDGHSLRCGRVKAGSPCPGSLGDFYGRVPRVELADTMAEAPVAERSDVDVPLYRIPGWRLGKMKRGVSPERLSERRINRWGRSRRGPLVRLGADSAFPAAPKRLPERRIWLSAVVEPVVVDVLCPGCGAANRIASDVLLPKYLERHGSARQHELLLRRFRRSEMGRDASLD